MVRSMTGFAAKTISFSTSSGSKTNITFQLKSLNSRYFEATCKLPYQLGPLEIELTRILQDKLYRGHIYFTVYVTNQDIFKGAIEPSLVTLDGYMNALDQIKNKYGLTTQLTMSDLLQLDNIFVTQEKGLDDELKKLILATTDQLITELITAQDKEGVALQKDLEKRIAIMTGDIDAIEKDSAVLMAAQKDKVTKTIQEVTGETTSLIDLQKHAAYALLDKMDINEEIVRFKSHLKNLAHQLATASQEKGKRLDFTLQEMAREVNTIAAKCSHATISSLAINIKVELEKAREQTQNIV